MKVSAQTGSDTEALDLSGLSLRGRRCVLTGASSGIGLAAAGALANLGADLVLVGRDRRRLEAAKESLADNTPQDGGGRGELLLEIADLSSLREIYELIERLSAFDRVDVLLNCAGVYATSRRLGPEGFESQFTVNYLAPHILSLGLLEKLGKGGTGRVISVSSDSHSFGHINWRDPSLGRFYLGIRAYAQSKLALMLSHAELARRLGPGAPVTILCADPGLANTDMGLKAGPSLSSLFWRLRRRGGTSPEVPARALAWLSAEPSLEGQGGTYWKNGRRMQPSRRASDPEAAARLWELTQSLLREAGYALPEIPSPRAREGARHGA